MYICMYIYILCIVCIMCMCVYIYIYIATSREDTVLAQGYIICYA